MAKDSGYRLTVVEGKNVGAVAELAGDVVDIGCGAEFSVAEGRVEYPDPSVSRLHAILTWYENEQAYKIANRSPISPVLVNGEPRGNTWLVPGEEITLGRLKLRVSAEEGVASSVGQKDIAKPVNMNAAGFLGEIVEEEHVKPAWLLPGSVSGSAPEQHTVLRHVDESVTLGETETVEKAVPQVSVASAPAKVAAEEQSTAPSESEPGPEPKAEPEPEPKAEPEHEPKAEPQPPVDDSPKPLGKIEVVRGQNRGRSIEVFGDFSIGRSPECDFVITDPQVSRRHCSIEFTDGKVMLRNHSTSSSTRAGRQDVRNSGVLATDTDITLANRVILHWVKY